MQKEQPLGEIGTALDKIGPVDIVIGIPSYNNARTIGHVIRAASLGLAKHFPECRGLIVNSDGGSTDGTREAALAARVDDEHLLLLSTPLTVVQQLSLPYHGIPGKGSAFRLIFSLAQKLGAKACAVVDSDLRSITPEWIELLISPILYAGQDLVTPYYLRHKYDGTITNSVVYPLTRTLYGVRVRQPIGGEFGLSARLVERYLQSDDWETDVARYGIDIWMTTTAIAEKFRVAQSYLGAKLHDAKDPSSDLSAMLTQVVGSVFALMQRYEQVWRGPPDHREVPLYGFRYDVGIEPVSVNVDRMIHGFGVGCDELSGIWATILTPETLAGIRAVWTAAQVRPHSLHISDDLWTRVVFDFAAVCAHSAQSPGRLIASFTPLYLGRVASFVLATESMNAVEVEARIEELCLTFESLKPYLIERWDRTSGSPRESKQTSDAAPQAKSREIKQGV
jgi:glycosyltransferase involved in cell wall biosynthesis